MKKFTAFLAAAMLCIAFGACGSQSGTPAETKPIFTDVVASTQPKLDGAVPRTGGDILGKSTQTLADAGITIPEPQPVTNDKTGLWRYTKIADNHDFNAYALDYYKTYFQNDDEVHVIINTETKTTTVIFRILARLDVTVYAYSEGEETDASTIAKGDRIAEYYIYTEDGEIEKVFG